MAALSGITIPILVVVGDRDARQASANALAARLGDSRHLRVPGDHYTALASPELATAITGFLRV